MGILSAYAVPHPPLIVPAVGRGEEKAVQKTIDSYHEIARRIARHKPDTIVVSSPHAPLFRDCFFVASGESSYGDMSRFRVHDRGIRVAHDEELVSMLVRSARERHVPLVSDEWRSRELDHATFVPLFFVNQYYTNYRLVRVGLSALPPRDHHEMGRCISYAVELLGRRCVFLASGDLSHKLSVDGPYGFAEEGPQFDSQITRIFADGNLDCLFDFDERFCEEAAECGLRSFQIMAGALEGLSVSSELLSYEGPFGVGYGVAAFEVEGSAYGDA